MLNPRRSAMVNELSATIIAQFIDQVSICFQLGKT